MKKKELQNPELKIANGLLSVIIFTEGIGVMTMELGTAQMMNPIYGNNLGVWTTVLGMTLLFLAIGYYCGGVITQKNKHPVFLKWLLILSALSFSLLPLIGKQVIKISDKLPWEIGWGFTVFTLLAIPLILLGTLSPVIIQFFSEKLNTSGKIAGKVFAISTLGNITAAFLLGFFLIPQIGVTKSVVIVSFLMLLLSIIILSKQNKTIALLLIFAVAVININNLKKKTSLSSSYRVLDFQEGLMGQLMVIDLPVYNEGKQTGWNRMVLNNRMAQTYINLENQTSLGSYYNYIPAISSIYPSGSKALLVGLGGGTIAKSLNDLGMDVTAVDLDKRMNQIAIKRFDLPVNVHLVTDDGRHYIKTAKEKYSVIIFDTFQGESMPPYLLTIEFFQEVKKILKPDGIILFNFYGFLSGSKGKVAKAIYKTLLAAGFQQVSIIPTFEEEETYRTIIFLASAQPVNFETATSKLNINGESADWGKIIVKLSPEELDSSTILRDDMPIQELWNLNSEKLWRQLTYKNLTKDFLKNGVPLFN